MTFSKLIVTILALMMISCVPREDQHKEIVFGLYCGECNEHCSTITKVTESGSYVDTSQVFFNWLFESRKAGDDYSSERNVRLSETTNSAIRSVLVEIPTTIYQYDERIGCPDCADGCGIYLQISDRYWLIDPKEYDDEELSRFVRNLLRYDSMIRAEIY